MNPTGDHRAGKPPAAEHTPPARDDRRHVFDNPKNVRRVVRLLFGICGLMLLWDVLFLFKQKHPSFEEGLFPIEGYFGFYSLYGFCACVVLVLVAKEMRKVLMRDEDHYEP